MSPPHFDIHDIFDFYQRISNARVLMTFKGAFSQELLVQIGELVKLQQGNNSKVQKMFAVFVEMAQNILHYSAEKEICSDGKEVGVGMIIIRENEKSFAITSANAIEKEKAEEIERYCSQLIAMTPEELKAFHQKKRLEEPPKGSKGAGLGLIEMIRKSDEKAEFLITQLDERRSFFILNIIIHKSL
ncbi:MAG: hypothetical protein D0433_03120 [Candidatus Thermochlorobacter aerophilum]|jgi:hypothetical protein|uniref:Uncharacterized protein n=1 Tax=Candidatus Thermochlorobacter aerophilus TaxID=1868324 RepID=A0A395M277_9BACT|nr:MAG: hypothetical protein D0433_03120 [Candidatus Thermochlorobacter aerophilum]